MVENKQNQSVNMYNTQLINKKTKIVGICTAISRIMGFIRIGVISAIFGASNTADILNLVLSIPNNLRKLLAEGALQNSFMPNFSTTVGEDNLPNKESNTLLIEVLFWGGFTSLVVVVLMSINAQFIIDFLFDISGADDLILASNLFSIAIYFLFLVTVVSVLMGILQIHKRFIIPAIAPVIMSICTILSMVLFYKMYGVFSAVYGYIFGGLLQFLLLIIALFSMGYRFHPKIIFTSIIKLPLFTKHFILIMKKYPSASLSVLIPIVGQQVIFYFASTLAVGSASALSYAIVFWQLPIGVFTNSIISVSFAYLLTFISNANTKGIKNCINNALYNLHIILLPLSIMGLFFAHAGISIAIQRGNMSSEATFLTAQIFQWYSTALLPFGIYLLFQKILFAYNKAIWVFIYTSIFTIVDLILSYVLIQTPLQITGISIALAISMLIILPSMYLHIHRITKIRYSLKKYYKIYLIQIPLIVLSWILSNYTQDYWFSGSTIQNILYFFIVACILLSIVIIGYKLIGVHLGNFSNKNIIVEAKE